MKIVLNASRDSVRKGLIVANVQRSEKRLVNLVKQDTGIVRQNS